MVEAMKTFNEQLLLSQAKYDSDMISLLEKDSEKIGEEFAKRYDPSNILKGIKAGNDFKKENPVWSLLGFGKSDTEEGINMEMEGRSYNTIKDMYNATFDEYEFCLNVEMEDLILHFDKTVEKILNFIDNNNFVGLDYSSLHLENNAKNREHSTNKTDVIDRYQKYFTENNYTHFQKIFSEIKREKYKYIF
jgi:hypothetical protein